MKIRFTPSGRLQFLTAVAHIQRDAPAAALKFRHRAERVLRRLLRFPGSLPFGTERSYRRGLLGRLDVEQADDPPAN